MKNETTICAISTPQGNGAIAILRLSGRKAIEICSKIFFMQKSTLIKQPANTTHFGIIRDDNTIIDEVIASVYHSPHSYTGEDMVEVSCHGSTFIQQKILQLFCKQGAQLARPGEFTLRAFLNGKLDLSQAEAVADLIASSSEAAHKIAINQMRGNFSTKIKLLREELLQFASLLELELDFSEEDVEFADRKKLTILIKNIKNEIEKLLESFKLGNVIKQGIPVAIIGKPNVGKSTLLNILLNEEKAIVSEIPGTTRDAIEDTYIINGVPFRFIDTAGLRKTNDKIESIGVLKTYEKIKLASIILFVFDINETSVAEIKSAIKEMEKQIKDENKHIIIIANKIDSLVEIPKGFKDLLEWETIFVSAKRRENINLITESLLKSVDTTTFTESVVVANVRHAEALAHALKEVDNVIAGIKNKLTTDLLALNIRHALHYLGEITGDVTNDEILGNIFSKFCIGK